MNFIDEVKRQISVYDKVVIAIDGPSASGKTTFGKLLSKKLDALLIHTDNYFLPKVKKTKERLTESGGNIDYERLIEEVMNNLYSKEIISNNFNCSTEKLEMSKPMINKQIVIVEGAYSMHRAIRKYYTLSLFITIDKQLQLERIRSRNGERMLKRWKDEWIPLENFYFKEENLENCVDYVIDTLLLPNITK